MSVHIQINSKITMAVTKHRRAGKIRSKVRRVKKKLKSRWQKFKANKAAWKSFEKGYRLGILYRLVLRPVHAIDTLDEILERAQQNVTDLTPVEAIGKFSALRNWFQRLNPSDFRQCMTTLGMGGMTKIIGCTPYYVIGFVSALLTYKLFKYWRFKRELDHYILIWS